MKIRLLLAPFAIAPFAIAAPLCAQTDAPSPIQIQSFDVQKAKLPNSKFEWTKLICKFTNTGAWADGISFNYSVLVQVPGGKANNYRVLTGGLTYMNIPKGPSTAILYMSPNATARFGSPIATSIDIFRGDRSLLNYQWHSSSASPDADWLTKYPSFAGGLLTVRSTPWVVTDTEGTPDLITN
jgi:hypothetical protein